MKNKYTIKKKYKKALNKRLTIEEDKPRPKYQPRDNNKPYTVS